MTLIVGILCTDGVVLASDSAATFGSDGRQTIGQQHVEKVRIVRDEVLYAATGAVGMSQVIAEGVGALWDANPFSKLKAPEAAMDEVGRMITGKVEPYLRTAQMTRAIGCDVAQTLCKSVVALVFQKRPYLFQFDYNGAPEQASAQLPFIAVGSGQAIADPFLAFLKRTVWHDSQPTLKGGRLAAVWTIRHACVTNPGGVGGPVQMAILRVENGRPVVFTPTAAEIEEHQQQITAAEAAMLGELMPEQHGEDVQPLPDPPAAS